MRWNVWRLWQLVLHEYLTNIYLSWEFALPSTTLLSISVHLMRFELNDLLGQLINLDNILDKLPGPPEFFSFLQACLHIKQVIILQCCPLSLHYCTFPKKAFHSPSVWARREYIWKLNWKESLLIYFENWRHAPCSHR